MKIQLKEKRLDRSIAFHQFCVAWRVIKNFLKNKGFDYWIQPDYVDNNEEDIAHQTDKPYDGQSELDKVSNYKPVTGLAHQACSKKIVWSLKPECSNRGSVLTSWPWIHAQKSARNSRNKHRTELRGVFQTGTRFNLRHCLCKHRWTQRAAMFG